MNWLNPLIVQQLGLTLLHFLWQGLIVGLLYAGSLALLRPTRASTRYNLAVATLVVLALLPPLTFAWLARQPVAVGSEGVALLGAEFMTVMLTPADSTLGFSPLLWVVALWLSGVMMLSARLALGWHYLRRLRRTADHLTGHSLQRVLEALQRQLGIVRPVGLAISRQVQSPVVIGLFKPLILLPPALLTRLPMDQVEMVLAHELAHIRRHDHLVNLFQTVVETLLFYHPVVAWVSRRIRVERENACDDLAVEATGNRLAYVEMLASLEYFRRPVSRLALGVQDGQILVRIRRLVERARPRGQRGVTLPAILLVTALAGGSGIYLMPERSPESTPETSQESVQEQASDSSLPMTPGNTDEARTEPQAPAPAEPLPLASAEPEGPTSQPAPAELQPQAPAAEPLETASQPTAAEQAPSEPETQPQPVEPQPQPRTQAVADSEEPPAPQAATPEPQFEPVSQLAERNEANAEAAAPLPGSEDTSEADASPLQMAALPERPIEQRATPPETRAIIEPPPITGGQLLDKVEPEFPLRARQRNASGLVELEFLVTTDGRVQEIEVLQESPANRRFAEAATAAVAQWRFEPFRQGEEPIDRRVRLEVEFGPYQGCVESLGSRIPRC